MSVGNVARVVAVLAAVLAAAGSATSSSNDKVVATQQGQMSPPPPQQMEPAAALGLWRTNFGAVKIEADNSKGGLGTGAVQGVWVYQRQGQEVVGYFSGNLRGNVLDFRWQEPNNPPLTGAGYLVFDPQGRQYSGRWWSDRRDRIGDWNGSRQAPQQTGAGGYAAPQPYGQQQPYGGQTGGASPYGGAAYGYQQPQPYYPQQQPPRAQQPYYPRQQPAPQPRPYYPQQPAPQGQPQPYYPPQQPYYPQQPAPQPPPRSY